MFKLEFAGTGGAVPLKNRNLSAALLSYEGRKFLFDVGEGTQQSLLKLHSGFANIDIICLSHLHGDHVFGLPGLLCTMGMAKRTNDLLILAPKGSRQLLNQFVCLVGRQDFSVYVLEFNSNLDLENKANGANMREGSSLKAKQPKALALRLTKFGYKIDLSLSDPKLLNPDNFYCLLNRKDLEANSTVTTALGSCAKLAEGKVEQANLSQIFPNCNLFYQADDPSKLLNNSRLQKKLHRYENLKLTYAPNTPASLYITSAPQKHSVNCIAFRFDWFKAGRFHAEQAKAKGIFESFWSYLQNGYSISYTCNKQAFKFTPASVVSPPVQLFSLGYVTDSRPLPSNPEFLQGVQVIISEANYLDESKKDLAVKNRHMTLQEACAQAKAAHAKILILTHFSASITEPDLYIDTAHKLFEDCYFAHDLDSFVFNCAKRQLNSETRREYVLTELTNLSETGDYENATN